MKNTPLKFMLCVVLILFGTRFASGAPSAYTLEDCWRAALRQSEQVGIQTELVTQAIEVNKEAKGALFPNISGTGSYQLTQAPAAGVTGGTPAEQTIAKVTATQPIFQGMKEWATLDQTNLNVTAAMSTRRQTAVTLYENVVTAVYTILNLEQQLRDFQDEVDAYQARINDLNRFLRIGRAKDSDVLTVVSAVDAVAAQAEGIRGQLGVQRQALAYYTGLSHEIPVSDTMPPEIRAEQLDYYVKRVELRPDVKAALDQMKSTEKNVPIARAGHFPTVNLQGDYYFVRDGGTNSGQQWDALGTLTIPIFAGGVVNAQVRQAASQSRQAQLNLDMVRRLADQDIRTNFSNFSSDIAQTEKLERSTHSAILSWKALKRDYQLGLATNIDVLTAITAAQTEKQALDAAKFQTKLDFIKLEAAAALRPLQNGGDFQYED